MTTVMDKYSSDAEYRKYVNEHSGCLRMWVDPDTGDVGIVLENNLHVDKRFEEVSYGTYVLLVQHFQDIVNTSMGGDTKQDGTPPTIH